MENNFKRFLSLLLAFVMVFGMFPANVFAIADGICDNCGGTGLYVTGWCPHCKTGCDHSAGYDLETGKCTICEYQCPHDWEFGSCKVCGYQCQEPMTNHDQNGNCVGCGKGVGHTFDWYGDGASCEYCGAVNPNYVIDTADKLAAALAAGGEVKLGDMITTTSNLIVPAGVTVVLDLNGYNIYREGTTQWNDCAIENKGNLTINSYTEYDEISGGTSGTAVINRGELTINGGVFKSYQDNLYVASGTAIITGGTFHGDVNGNYTAVEVKGGTFLEADSFKYMDNAVITGGTYAWELTNSLPEGYELVNNNNGTWTVAPVPVVSYVAQINGQGYETLAAAIAAVQNGETIELLADIYDDVTIAQQKNVAFTIDGMKQTATADTLSENEETINSNFYTCYGTLSINGTSYAGNQNQGLTIKNLNFVVDGYGIYTGGKTYPRNITIEDCSFTGTDGDNADYGIYLRYAYNINVKNSTADNLAYMISSAKSLTGFTAENLTIKNTNTGIRLVYVNSTALMKNVVIEDASVGIQIGNQASGTATIEDCAIEADTNIVLYQAATAKTKVTFTGENTMICTGENWLVNDTPDYFTVNYDGDGDENSNVTIVTIVAMIGETGYTSFDAAYAAAVAGDTITLLAPVTVTADTTYDLSGLTVVSKGDAFIVTDGTLTLDGDGVVQAGTAADDSYCAVWANGGNAVINGGTYSVGGDSTTTDTTHQNDAIYTKNGGTVKIYGGTFLNDGTVWTLNENDANRGTITVYGGTFQNWNPADNVSEGAGTSFLAEGYKSVESGDGYWTVTEVTYAAQIGETKYETLAEAIAAVQNGETITLLADNAESVTIKQTAGLSFTIDGNNKAYAYSGTITIDGNKRSTGTDTLTIQNVNFVGGSINALKSTYVHNLTVDGCHFDGGENPYIAITLRHSYNITVKNTTATNLNELIYNHYAVTGLLVENVEVTNSRHGLWMKYGTGMVFRNVKLDTTTSGINIANQNGTTTLIENCTITSGTPVVIREESASNVYTLVFKGNNSFTATEGDAWLNVEGQGAAVKVDLNEDNSLDINKVTFDQSYYTVENVENELWQIVKFDAAASIGNVGYKTLAEAIAAVKDGETITLLKDNAEDVTIKQVAGLSFTIDGAGKTYSGEITIDGNKRYTYSESLTIKNINFVTDKTSHIFIDADYSADGSTKMGNAHNITVENCTFTGPEGSNTVQGMRVRSGNKITFTGCTATNVMYLVQSTSAGNMLTVKDCSITAGYGIRVHNGNNALIQNVTLNTANMGIIFDGGQTRTATIENVTITGEGTPIYLNKATAGTQTLVMKGTNNIDGNWFTISGTGSTIVVDLTDDATLDIANVTYDTSYYGVETEGKVHTISKFEAVAKIGETGYATLAAAIAAVKDGETIVLLKDNAEDVTIKQVAGLSFTIDGAGKTYTGTITVTGIGSVSDKGQGLTVKNVNFVVDGYGIDAYAKNNYSRNITVDNCTFTGAEYNDYGIHLRHVYNITVKNTTGTGLFDLVYGGGAVTGFTAENVTVTDSSNGIMLAYVNSTAVFKNVTTDVIDDGVIIRNNAAGTVTFEGCNIDNVTYWPITAGKAVTMIFNDAQNNLVIGGDHSTLTAVLNQLDATLTAAEGLNVISGVEGQEVVLYQDGVYFLGDPVAQVGEKKFATIQAAVDAAVDGDTITVIADHEMVWDGKTVIDSSLASMVVVAGKSVTIDLNGKKLTVDANKMNGTDLYAVFAADEGGSLTLKDSIGTSYVEAKGVAFSKSGTTAYCMMMAYEPGTALTVEGGTYFMESAHDSLIYSGGNQIVTVKDGDFTLGNVGDGSNGKPWIFNCLGGNDGNSAVVTGGTYNADVANQYWKYEVYIPETHICEDNGDGTWTVHEGKFVAQITETGKKYATLEAAIAAVKNGETIVLLEDNDEDVTIKQVAGKAFTIDGAGKTYTGTIIVEGTGYAKDEGQALTVKNVNFVVDSYGIYAYKKSNFARNITVDGCTFTGVAPADGNDYGVALRHVYNITVTNTTGTGLTDLVYGGGAVTGFTAENVTVTDSIQAVWLSYPTGDISFKNVKVTNSSNVGVGFYNQAKATITFEDCSIDKIAYTEKGTYAVTMIFNDQENILDASEANSKLTAVLNQVDATLTAREGLNVIPSEELAKSYAVVYENGVYRLGKIIARNEQTGKLYMDLSDGLDEAVSGQTVTLLAETAEDLVLVGAGVTLDLNGHVVTADNALSFGVVMDTAETVGGIKISNKTTEAFTKLQPENGGYLPIYDNANGMYKFFEYKLANAAGTKLVGTNGVKFGIQLTFTNPAAYTVLAENYDNSGVELYAKIAWSNMSESLEVFVKIDPDSIKLFAEQRAANPNRNNVMKVTISGLDSLTTGDTISLTPILVTKTEVGCTIAPNVHTVG